MNQTQNYVLFGNFNSKRLELIDCYSNVQYNLYIDSKFNLTGPLRAECKYECSIYIINVNKGIPH